MGLASGAAWNGSSWVPSITDNDGLWTSMYGAGEMMRYAVVKEKRSGYSQEEILTARADALRPLKAVLLLAYISGREGTVDARIRYLNNTRIGKGNRLSEKYLLFNKIEAIENYPGSPSDYTGFTGVDAGTNKSGQYIGGSFRFSLGPVSPDDWAIDGPMATTPRTLKGFIARTFSLPAIEETPYDDGLFFGRNPNGTQNVLSQADRLYDYKPGDHPVIKVGNAEIPTILKDVLKVNNRTYNFTNVVYKGDTSTDEIIGHLFLYKIAYDTLDDNNPEEKEIRSLIRETVRNLATHMVENGYQLVDATGQGTKWGKTSRDYFTNDFAIEDNTLNSLVLLDIFKMAYYMTGEKRWQGEYLFLADSPGYRYADLVGKYWEHWNWLASNEDSDPKIGIYRLDTNKNPSSEEYLRHIQYSLNYSDEEMAIRHPLDTRRTQAYIAGSRPDVLDDSGISINPHVVIGNRTSESDIKKAENKMNSIIFSKYDPQQIYQIIALPQDERAMHKFNGPTFTDIGEFDHNIMEPSTTYTLPFWFGRYHHMLSA